MGTSASKPKKPIVENLVKECIDSDSVRACLNQYFNVHEKLLSELPRSLLPDIVEKPCRSSLHGGQTDEARTVLVDHIRNFYTVENLKHFCSELRRIAKMGFNTYTDVAKAIEEYLRWSPPSEEDLLAESDARYHHTARELYGEFIKFIQQFEDHVMKMSIDEYVKFHNCCRHYVSSLNPMKRRKPGEPVVVELPGIEERRDLLQKLNDLGFYPSCLEYKHLRLLFLKYSAEGQLMDLCKGYDEKVKKAIEEIMKVHDEDCDLKCGVSEKFVIFKKNEDCILGQIAYLREYLINTISVNRALFANLKEGCVQIIFIISGVDMDSHHLHAKFRHNLTILREMDIESITLSGAWTLNAKDGTTIWKDTQQGPSACIISTNQPLPPSIDSIAAFGLEDQRPDTHTDKNEKWRRRIANEQMFKPLADSGFGTKTRSTSNTEYHNVEDTSNVESDDGDPLSSVPDHQCKDSLSLKTPTINTESCVQSNDTLTPEKGSLTSHTGISLSQESDNTQSYMTPANSDEWSTPPNDIPINVGLKVSTAHQPSDDTQVCMTPTNDNEACTQLNDTLNIVESSSLPNSDDSQLFMTQTDSIQSCAQLDVTPTSVHQASTPGRNLTESDLEATKMWEYSYSEYIPGCDKLVPELEEGELALPSTSQTCELKDFDGTLVPVRSPSVPQKDHSYDT